MNISTTELMNITIASNQWNEYPAHEKMWAANIAASSKPYERGQARGFV